MSLTVKIVKNNGMDTGYRCLSCGRCLVWLFLEVLVLCLQMLPLLLTCTVLVGAGAVYEDAAFVVDMYCSCRCWCCV